MNTETPQGSASRHGDIPPNAGAENARAEATFSQLVADVARRIRELREFISYYIAARSDSLKLRIRNGIFYAVLGILGLIVAATAAVVAVTLFLTGIAEGLGKACGQIWIGNLIVGVVILGGIAIAAFFGASLITRMTRKQTVEKYESRKRDQRVNFGHDVSQRADSSS